ncbi:MAG TPA: hypothetical protein VFC87_07755 [Perlabentimonas sp.]|jgi:hypothetical protein|nr:hypothetical protein [Tenuifilaceae bacterium]HZJ74683.1 hypothetical protein [Perlabentimonas sp.]
MKSKFHLPLIILASFSLLFIGCNPVEEDDSCDIFDIIEEIAPQCEIPSVCPPDEGSSNYYILALDGTKYYCKLEDCNDATNTFIDEKCGDGVTAEQRAEIIMGINNHTRILMERVRESSICF